MSVVTGPTQTLVRDQHGLSTSWAQAMMERSYSLPVHVDIRISSHSGGSTLLVPVLALNGTASTHWPHQNSSQSHPQFAHCASQASAPISSTSSTASSQLDTLTLSVYNNGGPPPPSSEATKRPNLRRLTFASDTCICTPLWLLRGTEWTTGAVAQCGTKTPRPLVRKGRHCAWHCYRICNSTPSAIRHPAASYSLSRSSPHRPRYADTSFGVCGARQRLTGDR